MLQSPITEISIFSSPFITEWEWRRKKKNLYLLLLWQAFLQALLSYHAWEITWASSQKKTVFGGLGTTKLQTSLRFRAVWSVPLLFPFWKAPYLSLLHVKSLFSVHPTSPSGSEEGRRKIYTYCFCGKHFPRPSFLTMHERLCNMGLVTKKPVFGGLGTTKAQTSLRICAVWSAPLLFPFWKAPYLSFLLVKSLFSVHPISPSGSEESPSGSEEGRKKVYTCCFCGKHFSRPSFLTMHERLHYGEKPYKCSTCDKSFSRPSALATHQRIHTVEFPHKCDVCGMRFTDVESLMSHQTIHMYKCSTCDKSFRLHGNLDRHMRIHDIEKPYKCDVCGERFTVVESLLSHQTTHKKKLFIPVVQIHY